MDVSAAGAPTDLISGPLLSDGQRRAIAQAGGEILLAGAAGQEDAALQLVGAAEVWFGPGLTARLLAHAGRLRWLQVDGVGVDHYLFPELVASGVVVTPVRHRHTTAADHVMALLLALVRGLPQLVRQQSASQWRPPSWSEVLTLSGSEVVIIGTGQIGSAIASRASAFGMTPVGVSRSGRSKPGFHRVFRTDELITAVGSAGFVVDTCPLTPETTGLVSRAVFHAMLPGAVFINVGRGETVDQGALVECLRDGKLRAAALDVFLEEPLPPQSDLWDVPNLLITPHCGGVVPGAPPAQLGVEALVENLVRYRDGLELVDPVSKERGY